MVCSRLQQIIEALGLGSVSDEGVLCSMHNHRVDTVNQN